MKNGTYHLSSRFLRRLLSSSLWLGLLLALTPLVDAQEYQLESTGLRVFIENQTAEEHEYTVHWWLGSPPEPEEPEISSPLTLGPEDTGYIDLAMPGGEVSVENTYPNLIGFTVYRDGVAFYQNAAPYRRDEEDNYYVPNESFSFIVVADEPEPPPASGMTYSEFLTTSTESLSSLGLAAEENKPTQSEIELASAEQKALAEAAMEAVPLPDLGEEPIVSTENSLLTFTVPGIGNGGGVEMTFDPMNYPEIADVLPFIKACITWSMLVMFCWWAWLFLSQAMYEAGSAQQAKGNTVAGTGGQITAFASAVLITVVMVGVPLAVSGLFSGIQSLLGGDNPFNATGPTVETALYLVGLTLDYNLMWTLITSAFVLVKGKTVIVAGVQAAVRIIVL